MSSNSTKILTLQQDQTNEPPRRLQFAVSQYELKTAGSVSDTLFREYQVACVPSKADVGTMMLGEHLLDEETREKILARAYNKMVINGITTIRQISELLWLQVYHASIE